MATSNHRDGNAGPDVMKFPPGVPQTAFTRTAQTGHHTDL